MSSQVKNIEIYLATLAGREKSGKGLESATDAWAVRANKHVRITKWGLNNTKAINLIDFQINNLIKN